jgi:hypothetical protein
MDADSGRHLSKFPRWKVSVAWSADDRLWREAVVEVWMLDLAGPCWLDLVQPPLDGTGPSSIVMPPSA